MVIYKTTKKKKKEHMWNQRFPVPQANHDSWFAIYKKLENVKLNAFTTQVKLQSFNCHWDNEKKNAHTERPKHQSNYELT